MPVIHDEVQTLHNNVDALLGQNDRSIFDVLRRSWSASSGKANLNPAVKPSFLILWFEELVDDIEDHPELIRQRCLEHFCREHASQVLRSQHLRST